MTLELTDEGLSIQTLEEIRDELKAAFVDPTTGVDPLLDVSDDSLMGRWIGIMSEREASIQQQIQGVYTAGTIDATGVALARVSLLTGTVKDDATYSTVVAQVTLAAGATLPAGKQANVLDDANSVFATDVAVTNPGGSPATLDVVMTALVPGPIRAPAGTLTVITGGGSPGWTAVNNSADALLGSPAETDPDLRARRQLELNDAASAELSSIVTAVRAVANVRAAVGYENVTSSTDGDGLPPHSYEIVTYAPTAASDRVAQAIWDNGDAGIASVHGTAGTLRTGNAVDKVGVTHAVNWTSAAATATYYTVDVLIDADLYPVDGDAQVRDAIVAFVNSSNAIGKDVVVTKLYAPIYSVPGVLDVTSLTLGTAPSPVGTGNITIGSRGIATASPSNTLVTSHT